MNILVYCSLQFCCCASYRWVE